MSLEAIRSYVIRRISLASDVEHSIALMLSEAQYREIQAFLICKQREAGSRHIQDILPCHSAQEREFIWTGTTAEDKNLAEMLNRARRACLVDFAAIRGDGRVLQNNGCFNDGPTR